MIMDETFSRAAFLETNERQALCRKLQSELESKLAGPEEFETAVASSVAQLKLLGHDLWSFDESDDFQAWCPNWHSPSGPGLVITFYSDGTVEVAWSSE